jgi:DNA modification methylase
LIQACIANSSKPGALVADPFGGSGSTLIAAAREGRRARLIELDVRYCDVIRKRWGDFARSAGVDAGPGAL